VSTVVTIIQVVATRGRASECGVVASVITLIPGVYGISCNGNDRGHECPASPDALIEPGDTWSDRDVLIAFAEKHINEHEARS